MERTFLGTITGSFSTPAADNPTVVMIEAAFAHHGIDGRYVNCDVDSGNLGDAVAGARAMGWAGFNCSIPHKVAVIDHLDGLEESAELIGAVNCVVETDGDLIGHNTDGAGFVESLRPLRDPRGIDVVVLGAGGAARAIAVETALAGASSITIVNRSQRRGEELARLVREGAGVPSAYVPWTAPYAVDPTTAVLVNATSIGFGDVEAMPLLDPDTFRRDLVVADVIVNPLRTALLRSAEEAGAVTLDGLGMLVGQGARAVQLWTGIQPDRDVMRRAVVDALGL